MMDTEHLKNNLALTRTENYFLAWMKNFYDVSSLYGYSFVELKRVFADFLSAARYEKYGGVPSLLSIAEKNGIVSHRRFPAPVGSPCSAVTASEFIRGQKESALCLVRVNEKFFGESPRRKSALLRVDNALRWVNGGPISAGQFTAERFEEVFGGGVDVYEAEDLNARVGEDCGNRIRRQDFFEIHPTIGLEKFSRAMRVLLTTRRRMAEYYKNQTQMAALWRRDCKIFEDLYFQSKRQLYNRTKNESELYRTINDAIRIERQIAEAME